MKYHPQPIKTTIFNASNGGGQINKKLVRALNRNARRKEHDYEEARERTRLPGDRHREKNAYA